MAVTAPRHIVVRCHPEQQSFNAAMASAYCAEVRQQGHEVFVRDLYAMGFDPVLKSVERAGPDRRTMPDVRDELDIIGGADVFVLVYPIWFGGPPAMLKGYLERVLGTGTRPDQFRQRAAPGVLAGKRMVSFSSSAADEHWLATEGQFDALITGFDRYIEHGFAMAPSEHIHFGEIVDGIDSATIDAHLAAVRVHARRVCETVGGP